MKKGKHEAGYIPREEKTNKKPRKKRRGCLIVFITFLIILAMLIAAAVIYWKSNVKPPKTFSDNNTGSNGISIFGGFDIGKSSSSEEQDPDEEDLLGEIEGQGKSISVSGNERREDCFTMLVLGLDKSDLRTDTIVVATFNVKDKTAAVLNIPRDSLSSYRGGKIHKINSAYASGGIEQSIEEIENLIGFEIDRHVIITCDAFKKLIDNIGGIDYYVPQDMYKVTDDMVIDLKEGQQHLDGERALMYMRFRGYPNADLARIEAQQTFYQAVIEKVARPATVLKLPSLASTVLNEVDTDLTLGEMIWIGLNYSSMDTGSMVYNTLPNVPEYINNISYVIPQEKAILKMVNEYYNPYTQQITSLNLTPKPSSNENHQSDISSDDNEFYDSQGDDDTDDWYIEYPDEGEDADSDEFPIGQDEDIIIGNDPELE